MSKYYGIDLGTTYSAIAKVGQDGKPVIIKNKEGNTTTPSVINFLDDGTYVVGETAKNDVMAGGVVIEEVKKYMNEKDKEYNIPNGQMDPITISSLILKKLKEDAEEQGEEIAGVTITCPAYFGIVEKANTQQAGEIAGLNVLNIINEPTAAAYAYIDNINEGEIKNILVYDLGGGTFDITLITIEAYRDTDGKIKKKITTGETGGDAALGGKDFDRKLIELVISKIISEQDISEDEIKEDHESYRDIIIKTEDAKKALTFKENHRLNLSTKSGRVRIEITREEFENITQSLINSTLQLTEIIIDNAKQNNITLDTVLLVGGSTRMPMVRNTLEKFEPLMQILPSKEIISHDPDEAVAKGAALWANLMGEDVETYKKEIEDSPEGKVTDQETVQKLATLAAQRTVQINDRINKSYGIVALVNGEEKISNIILRGVLLDSVEGYTSADTYYATEQNQSSVAIRIMETNTDDKVIDLSAGTEIYDFVFPLPNNFPTDKKIDVTFRFDVSAILHITIREELNNTFLDNHSIQITGALSQEEVEEAMKKVSTLVRTDD